MNEGAKALLVVHEFKQCVEISGSHVTQDALITKKGQRQVSTHNTTRLSATPPSVMLGTGL